MSQVFLPPTAVKAKSNWLSVVVLTLSLLAFAVGLGLVVLLIITSLVNGMSSLVARDTLSILLLTASTALITLVVLPGGIYALADVMGKPVPAAVARFSAYLRRVVMWAPLLWVAVVLLGTWVSRMDSVNWLVLPLLHALAVSLPVLWFIGLASRGVRTGGAGRAWGIFGIAAAYNTTLLIMVELVVSLVIGLAFLFLLFASDPGLARQLTLIAQRLVNSGMDAEAIQRILRPLISRPLIIYTALAMFSGVVPLLEELFKALPVWVLASVRKISPAEGLIAGVLSGGAMALVESLGFSTSISQTGWTEVVMQRAGTDLLHITTTGLVGWAIASAVAERRYLRLVGCLILAVLIHGTWNGLALLAVVSELRGSGTTSSVLAVAAQVAPYALAGLGLALFGLLFWLNRKNRTPAEAVSSQATIGYN